MTNALSLIHAALEHLKVPADARDPITRQLQGWNITTAAAAQQFVQFAMATQATGVAWKLLTPHLPADWSACYAPEDIQRAIHTAHLSYRFTCVCRWERALPERVLGALPAALREQWLTRGVSLVAMRQWIRDWAVRDRATQKEVQAFRTRLQQVLRQHSMTTKDLYVTLGQDTVTALHRRRASSAVLSACVRNARQRLTPSPPDPQEYTHPSFDVLLGIIQRSFEFVQRN